MELELECKREALERMPKHMLSKAVMRLGIPHEIVQEMTHTDLVNTILKNIDVIEAAGRRGIKRRNVPEIELPCGKRTDLIPENCLAHILSLVCHPKVGHPVFWKVEILLKSERQADIIASVDPLMLEATGLQKARLGAHLKPTIRDLSPYLPNDIELSIVVQKEVQQVLGVIQIAGQPEETHKCGGDR